MQMHGTHLDNHDPSTMYTTDDSIHMARDEPDRDAPLLVMCRNPGHPDGPSRKKPTHSDCSQKGHILPALTFNGHGTDAASHTLWHNWQLGD
jgi:hypothetical protein